MLYKDMNEVRIRMNQIAVKLNAATNYGRRPLPKEFADLDREWNELADIKPANFKRTDTIPPSTCIRRADRRQL